MGVAVRTTAQRRSLAHTCLGQGVFVFSSIHGVPAAVERSRGHFRVLQRSGRGSERSVETERGDLQMCHCERGARLGASLSPRSPRYQQPTWPSRALAALALPLGQDKERAARSTPVRPWRQRRLHLGLGAPLSDQLSVVDPTNPFGPVTSLLTFPSSATTKPSSEVRSRTRLQVPHQQRRLGSQDTTEHTQCV